MASIGIDLRREIEGRQGRVITQTIIRPSTTFITYATLGLGPPTIAPEPTPTPTPTPEAPVTVVPSSSSSSNLTSEQIGAILGSVFGFVLLLLILCTCLSLRRRRLVRMYPASESSEDEVIQVVAGSGPDPWNRPGRMPGLVPPPARIPPTPRHATYRQTRHVQMRGVQRYP